MLFIDYLYICTIVICQSKSQYCISNTHSNDCNKVEPIENIPLLQ